MAYVVVLFRDTGPMADDIEMTDVVGEFTDEHVANQWGNEVGLPNPGGWAPNSRFVIWSINPVHWPKGHSRRVDT